ncbi:hypothetical protein JTE90_011863 [Oedothorax gibbosus]|uniref:Uncharacterized protein n=1 Tax=Oedothorax gibbosus TaxID=931172 RepID=A0AAV6V3W1_9ARAC|nr:hypothetical protein JTE90_011863 [Oedothorax gibbosus]
MYILQANTSASTAPRPPASVATACCPTATLLARFRSTGTRNEEPDNVQNIVLALDRVIRKTHSYSTAKSCITPIPYPSLYF